MKRDWLTLAFGAVLVWVVVALSLRQNMTRQPSAPTPLPESTSAVAATAPGAGSVPAPTAEVSGPTASAAAAKTKPLAVPARSSVSTPATNEVVERGVTLQVQSDVAGASVFLDREFVGTTPLNLRGVTAGSKQLNVTATGHEGYAANINLAEGLNRVNVEFMKVRVNATVPVIHRHAMGSCQGVLAASPKGLSYDTTNKADAFTLAFADIDAFDMDYLKKNLRVHRRTGKTWNFTNDSADALFVFHRDVDKAREKLATTR